MIDAPVRAHVEQGLVPVAIGLVIAGSYSIIHSADCAQLMAIVLASLLGWAFAAAEGRPRRQTGNAHVGTASPSERAPGF